MKFTDGYWQMRAGVTPHYASQVHEVQDRNDTLTVYAPTGKLRGRGDTLNLPLLTVQFSSPIENVIQVLANRSQFVRPWQRMRQHTLSMQQKRQDADRKGDRRERLHDARVERE